MRRTVWLLAFAAFALACLGFWGLAVWQDRSATLAHVLSRNAGLARLLEAHAGRAVDAGDNVVRSVADVTGAWDLRDPATGHRIWEELRDRIAASPQIGAAWILDADGDAVLDTWVYPPAPGNYAHRDYYRAHLDPDRGLFIGATDTGTTSGKPRFTLSGAIRDADGGLRGVAATGIYSEYFARLYGEAGLGPRSGLALLTTAGAALAEWPLDGVPRADQALFPLLREQLVSAPSGAFTANNGADARLIAYRVLPDRPLAVAVSTPMDEALSGWRERTWRSGMVAAAALGGFGLLVGMGMRAGRRAVTALVELERANRLLDERVRERTAELARSEARLGLAVDAAAMAEWECDLATGAYAPSPRLNQLFAYPPDRPLTIEDVRARYHPDDAETTRQRAAMALATGEQFTEHDFRIVLPDGSVRWLYTRGETFRDADGRAVRAAGVVMDISERKRVERRLRRERELLQRIMDTIPVMIVLYEPSTKVLRLNREFERLTGWSTEAARGVDLMEKCYPDPEYRESVRAYMASLQEGWRDLELTTRDGRVIQTSWANIRLSDDTHVGIGLDITERKRAEEHRELLLAELSHRVKNTLATVQSIAAHSLRGGRPLEEAHDAFVQRLGSLANTHSLLTAGDWQGASLRGLVEAELAPYGRRAAVIAGDDLVLKPRAAVTLGLVLHELATNAAKYGALTAPAGRAEVAWGVEEDAADGPRLRLSWREQGGPPVAPPEHRGFGAMLIERAIAYDLDGTAHLAFTPDGVTYELAVPLAEVTAAA